jgi:hypothetical protein
MRPDFAAQINALVNVALGAIVSIYAFRCSEVATTPFGKWIRYIYVLVGLCWSGFYIATFVGAFNNINTIHLGQMIFRPTVTVTLAVIAVDHIWKKKLNGGCK